MDNSLASLKKKTKEKLDGGKGQHRVFRGRLLQKRNELRERLGMAADLLSESSTMTGDSADLAFCNTTQYENSSAAKRNQEDLRRVEKALENLQRRTYGKCEMCLAKGKVTKIDPGRLNFDPATLNCVECQRRVESGTIVVPEDNDGDGFAGVPDANEAPELDLRDIESRFAKR